MSTPHYADGTPLSDREQLMICRALGFDSPMHLERVVKAGNAKRVANFRADRVRRGWETRRANEAAAS